MEIKYKKINGEKHKHCFRCGEYKPFPSGFYKHKQMGDGTLNKCKDCTKADTKKREEEKRKDPNWVEQERIRSREKYHRLDYKEKYAGSNVGKYEYTKERRNMYPEKYKARTKVQRIARKDGFELHHWSYLEQDWSDVIQISKVDHSFLHRYMEYDQEQMKYRCTRDLGQFKSGDLLDTKYRHIKYYLTCKQNIDL